MATKAVKTVMRDIMEPENFYKGLDKGIRFAVRVLHAAGIYTCQSCEGGKGHSYAEPTVDIPPRGWSDAEGFRALAALHAYDLPVQSIAILWNIETGLPVERIWRVTFSDTMIARADEKPMFIHGYRTYG
jgi:hypothetical protein